MTGARYARVPSVRLRSVPEQGVCLAYTPPPARPALHGLNLAAWLVLSLCDRRDETEIITAYITAIAEADALDATPAASVRQALDQLQQFGLITGRDGDQRVLPAQESSCIEKGGTCGQSGPRELLKTRPLRQPNVVVVKTEIPTAGISFDYDAKPPKARTDQKQPRLRVV
jgi:hypothetical protein